MQPKFGRKFYLKLNLKLEGLNLRLNVQFETFRLLSELQMKCFYLRGQVYEKYCCELVANALQNNFVTFPAYSPLHAAYSRHLSRHDHIIE